MSLLGIGDEDLSKGSKRIESAIHENAPKKGLEQYKYWRVIVRFALMRDLKSGEMDMEQIVLFRKLLQLIELAKGYRNADHYKIGFVRAVAQMTHCIKDTRGHSIAYILALWLVPEKVRSTHTKHMTEDRIEYVLKLAKENGMDVKHI
jgi:hypothetical protein